MKIKRNPIVLTILMGLFFSLSFIPFVKITSQIVNTTFTFRFSIWLFYTIYALYLANVAKKSLISIFFPLLLPFIFVFPMNSKHTFFILTIISFGWIRSGICFSGSFLRGAVLEILLNFGGALFIAYFSPRTLITWAIGLWMYFLIQSLYFVFVTDRIENPIEDLSQDAFEKASRRAEEILS